LNIQSVHKAIIDEITDYPLSPSEREWVQEFVQRRMLIAFSRVASLGDFVTTVGKGIQHNSFPAIWNRQLCAERIEDALPPDTP